LYNRKNDKYDFLGDPTEVSLLVLAKKAGVDKKELAEKMEKLEYVRIHSDFNYDTVKGLSSESREKMKKMKPLNLGQASRISGVNPADISILMVYLGR